MRAFALPFRGGAAAFGALVKGFKRFCHRFSLHLKTKMPSENRDGWDCANTATLLSVHGELAHCLIFHPLASDGISGQFPAGLPAVILLRQLVYGVD